MTKPQPHIVDLTSDNEGTVAPPRRTNARDIRPSQTSRSSIRAESSTVTSSSTSLTPYKSGQKRKITFEATEQSNPGGSQIESIDLTGEDDTSQLSPSARRLTARLNEARLRDEQRSSPVKGRTATGAGLVSRPRVQSSSDHHMPVSPQVEDEEGSASGPPLQKGAAAGATEQSIIKPTPVPSVPQHTQQNTLPFSTFGEEKPAYLSTEHEQGIASAKILSTRGATSESKAGSMGEAPSMPAPKGSTSSSRVPPLKN